MREAASHLSPVSPAEKLKSHLETPLEENINRQVLEEGAVEARTIEDAIAVLRWERRLPVGAHGAGCERFSCVLAGRGAWGPGARSTGSVRVPS